MGLDSKKKKKEVNFSKFFDNPLSKYLILKRIPYSNGCFGLFTKFNTLSIDKVQCQTFFPSQDMKPYVLLSS